MRMPRSTACSGVAPIAAAFPDVVREGAVDRNRLRAALTAEPAGWKTLEGILHPRVRAARRAFLARCRRQGFRIAVLDVPLLLETAPNPDVDIVLVVSTSAANQMARLRRRVRMTKAELTGILGRQMPDAEKRRRADIVVKTGLSKRHAQVKIIRLIRELRG
jgi:dephospho-CoA kinase